MNLPGSFDTVIALVAIYLVIAILCSHVKEQLAAIWKWRGEELYAGILNLLVGEASVVSAIYEHPLITSTSRDSDGKAHDRPYRPTFIDSRNFSLALWDTIQRTNATPAGDAVTVHDAQSFIATPYRLFSDLSQKVVALPHVPLRRHLAALVNEAQGDYDRLLRATDAWFDRQMDRVSGWYKRRAQFVLLLISLVIVFGCGIDSIRITAFLYADSATRGAIVANVLTAFSPASTTSSPRTNTADSVALSIEQGLPKVLLDTYFTGPLGGWSSPKQKDCLRIDVLHFLGLFITALAGALGSPFWFDLLNTMVNVRLSGPKPIPRNILQNTPSPPGR